MNYALFVPNCPCKLLMITFLFRHNLHMQAIIFHHSHYLEYRPINVILMISSCSHNFPMFCNTRVNGTGDLWGHSICADTCVLRSFYRHVFPFKGRLWGQFILPSCTISLRKNVTHAPGWRGNRRFVGHLVPLFLCCCRGVQGLSVWFTVMADCFLPLAAQAHSRTDGKVNVYKTVEVCWQENSTKVIGSKVVLGFSGTFWNARMD